MFTRFIKYCWNYDFAADYKSTGKGLFVFLLIIAVGYSFAEVFLKVGNPGVKFGLADMIAYLRTGISPEAPVVVKQFFPYVWIAVAVSCFLFRVSLIIHSYFLSLRVFGEQNFRSSLATYLLSAVLALFVTLVFFACTGLLFFLTGHSFQDGFNVVGLAVRSLQQWLNAYIPTLIHLPYPVAVTGLLVGFSLSSLSGYFIHWLTHKSRFLWLTVHRAHHMPEILHPLGAPLAFNFDFFLAVPALLFNVLLMKLIYEQPLILETTIVLLIYYHFEIFNHATVYYALAFRHKIIRLFSMASGNGIYHYMHHTSAPGKEMVNLGGGLFLFWDRLFGTYGEPPGEAPRVGLTNNPQVHMNPLRVVFSGFAQLAFELRENKNWLTRLQIIFGNIYYKPPVTKEFLIINKPL